MASRFKIKGTTENEFQIGLNGPIIKRLNSTSTDSIVFDKVYAGTLYFGSISSYINSDLYTGTSEKANRLSNPIDIVNAEENNYVTFTSTGADGSLEDGESSSHIKLNFTAIDSAILTGDILYDRLQHLVQDGELGRTSYPNQLAGANHTHSQYMGYGKTIQLPESSDLKIGESGTTVTITKNDPITLDLKLKDGKVLSSHIKDGAVTTEKIGDAQVTVDKLAAGDYSSKIENVAHADGADRADTLTNTTTFWGQEFNGSQTSILGSIENTHNITPEENDLYNIGSPDKKYANGYFSKTVSAKDVTVTNSVTTESLTAGDITSDSITNSGNLSSTGDVTLGASGRNITVTGNSTTLNGKVTVNGGDFVATGNLILGSGDSAKKITIKSPVDATGYTITATRFNGTASLSEKIPDHRLWGNLFNGTQDVSGDIALDGHSILNAVKITSTTGTSNTSVGTADNPFSTMYATTFHGDLSGKADRAANADKVANSLTINTTDTAPIAYNGSAAKTLDLKADKIINLDSFIENKLSASFKGLIEFTDSEKTKYTPDAKAGDMYVVHVPAGVTGATLNGISVENGTFIICISDSDAGNSDNVSTIASNWNFIIMSEERTDLVSSSLSSSTKGNLAVFADNSGKVLSELDVETFVDKKNPEDIEGLKSFKTGVKIGSNGYWDFSSEDKLVYKGNDIFFPDATGTLATTNDIHDITITGDQTYDLSQENVTLAKVSKTGSYNDLSDKPEIPEIPNITINASSNKLSIDPLKTIRSIQATEHNIAIETGQIPSADTAQLGLVKLGYSTSGRNYKVQKDNNNNIFVNVPWQNTTYTFTNGTDGSFTVSNPAGGDPQKVTIGTPAEAGHASSADNATSADKVKYSLNFLYGDGNSLATYNGSKEINFDFAEVFRDLNTWKNKGSISFTTSEKTKYTPAGNNGDTYFISCIPTNLSGCTLNGKEVFNGDIVICNADSTAAGNSNNASTISKAWTIIKANNINEANLVHKTGNETISGEKAFDGTLEIKSGGKLIAPKIYSSSSDSTGKTITNLVEKSDLKNITVTNGSTYNPVTTALTLAKVAETGNYNDLLNKPDFPEIPDLVINNGTKETDKVITSLSEDNDFQIDVGKSFIKTFVFNSSNNTVTTEHLLSDTSGSVSLNQISKTGLLKSSTTTGTGNVVSDISIANGNTVTLTKITALTSHQPIKKLNTNNSTAQTVQSNEVISGDGIINLHKVAKTGSYNDLLNKPVIPSIPNISITNTVTNQTGNLYVKAATANGHVIDLKTGPLNLADTSNIGGIKLGFADNDVSRNYGVKLDSSGKAYVSVPWDDAPANYLTTNTEQDIPDYANKTVLGTLYFSDGTTTTGLSQTTKNVANSNKSVLDVSNLAYFEKGIAAIGTSSSQQGIYTQYITGMSSSGTNTALVLNYNGSNASKVDDGRLVLLASNAKGSDYSSTLARGKTTVTNPLYQYSLVRGDTLRDVLNKDLETSAQWINSKALTNENLNNYNSQTTCGFYHAAGSNSVTNKPANVDSFGLIVFRSANGYFTQLLYCGTGTGSVENLFTRHYLGGSWTGWRRILSVVQGALTSGRVLVSGSNDTVTASSITTTQLGYLSGVTSNIQNQINSLNSEIGSISSNSVHKNENMGSGSTTASAPYISGGIIDTHPENRGTVLSPYINDLAQLLKRNAGSIVIKNKTNSKTFSSNMDNIFDVRPSYTQLNGLLTASSDVIEIIIKSKTNYSYTTTFGISFGSTTWRASNIKIESGYSATNTGTASSPDADIIWKTVTNITNNAAGTVSASGNGPGTSASTWNYLRYTLSDFSSVNPRIAQIFTINYNSKGLAAGYVDRSGGDIYGSLNISSAVSANSITSNTATIAGSLINSVTGNILGTSTSLMKVAKQIYAAKGVVFGGTAAQAGLVTRGICGVSTPDSSNGECNKENLYINYDGDSTYREGRQIVIQAESTGTKYNDGIYAFTAVRGDKLKAYIENFGNTTDAGDVHIGTLWTKTIMPEANAGNTYDIGSSSAPYKDIYAARLHGALTGNVTGNLTGNASTATKANQLTNARTLWGQSFNGTANISGDISTTGNITPSANGSSSIGSTSLKYRSGNFSTSVNIGNATLQYNSDDECLDFIFS